MALYATPARPSEAALAGLVQRVGSQNPPTATEPCLVCGRPATWRIERPDGSYLVCDWCALIIRDYDARHPEHEPSRHVRLVSGDGLPQAPCVA
jgi:hypothetical protein